MRRVIATFMFYGGLLAWLVAAGILIGVGAEFVVWAVWGLLLPALLVVVAMIAPRGARKEVPPPTKVINVHVDKPRFGVMEGDE